MLRLSLALSLVVLVLVLHRSHSQCPAQCSECSPGAQAQYHCQLGHVDVWIDVVKGRYARIQCEEGQFSCADVPSLDVGEGRAMELELQSCEPPADDAGAAGKGGLLAGEASGAGGLPAGEAAGAGGLQCVGARVGAGWLRKLLLREWRAELNAGLVRGLDRLLTLSVYWDSDMTLATPFPAAAALGALPSLQNLTLSGGSLSLRPEDLLPAPRLVHLELSRDRIRDLPRGLLQNLTRLKTLLLWGNDIEELEDGVFDGLSSLQLFSLSSNKLSSFPVTSPLPELRELSLYHNQLRALQPLTGFHKLREIQLFDNQVPLAVSPGALSHLPELKRAELQRSGITTLPPDTFRGSDNLQHLDLSGNELVELPAQVFADQRRLVMLDLSGNRLRELSGDVFRALGDLRELRLDHNELETLPSGLLQGLEQLSTFSSSHNRLRVIAFDALQGAPALTDLDLSYNELTFDEPQEQRYSSHLLSPLNVLAHSRISTIQLQHNLLRAAPPDVPDVLLQLTMLNLAHNQIDHLTFYDIGYLKDSDLTVDFSYNNISVLYLRPPTMPATPSSGRGHPPATALLRGNPLDCDCRLYQLARRLAGARQLNELILNVEDTFCEKPGPFRGRPVSGLSLDEFECRLPAANCSGDCSCTLRPHRALFQMSCLQEPPTFHNRTTIEDFLYTVGAEKTPSIGLKLKRAASQLTLSEDVTVVNMSGVGLSEPPALRRGSGLRLLDLSDNSLSRPPLELLRGGNLSLLRGGNLSLLMGGNPLLCSCRYRAQLADLKKMKERIADYAAVTCDDGVPFDSLNIDQLCSALVGGLVGGSLAAVGLLFAAAAALAVRYSLEIRVLLYRCRWLRRWFPEDERDADRKYDAFVSFAHEDEHFVVEQLLPGLEGKNGEGGLKLCVHYRDWVAGEWIPAQIASSVEQSRRTLVVLSRHFLSSKWGRLEFRAANMAADTDRTARVIVVLMEDVSDHRDLDAEIKAYLNTNTYLKWGDPWFWDKLRYALPHRKEEKRAREKGDVLANLAVEGATETEIAAKRKGGGIDARLTPDGKIVNMAAIAGDVV